MRILAIETAVIEGSVACLENNAFLDEIRLDPKVRTTRTLTPAIQDLLRRVGWQPRQVEGVCVSMGPGSFTGLRIGVTAGKAFAYATKAALCGVNTLYVLAAPIPLQTAPLWTVMNAERGQIYAGHFVSQDGEWSEASAPRILDADVFFDSLAPGSLLAGPGLRDFSAQLPRHAVIVDEQFWIPRAATVGHLGFRKLQAGEGDDLWSLSPFYLRDSAAQEKAKGT